MSNLSSRLMKKKQHQENLSDNLATKKVYSLLYHQDRCNIYTTKIDEDNKLVYFKYAKPAKFSDDEMCLPFESIEAIIDVDFADVTFSTIKLYD